MHLASPALARAIDRVVGRDDLGGIEHPDAERAMPAEARPRRPSRRPRRASSPHASTAFAAGSSRARRACAGQMRGSMQLIGTHPGRRSSRSACRRRRRAATEPRARGRPARVATTRSGQPRRARARRATRAIEMRHERRRNDRVARDVARAIGRGASDIRRRTRATRATTTRRHGDSTLVSSDCAHRAIRVAIDDEQSLRAAIAPARDRALQLPNVVAAIAPAADDDDRAVPRRARARHRRTCRPPSTMIVSPVR